MTRGSRLLHSNVVLNCLIPIPDKPTTDFPKLRHHHLSSSAICFGFLAAVYGDSQA
jgi:hypothetical protein